jgi:hypothetical protein
MNCGRLTAHSVAIRAKGINDSPRPLFSRSDSDKALRLTLKAAALELGFVTEAEVDRVFDSTNIVRPYAARAS